MFGLCNRGGGALWRRAGRLAGGEAPLPLPSVRRPRLRPGTLGASFLENQRNMILAIVLSAIVLFGWSALSNRFLPTANPPATKVVQGKQVPLPNPTADATADKPQAVRSRA